MATSTNDNNQELMDLIGNLSDRLNKLNGQMSKNFSGEKPVDLRNIPQGPGSRLDSDTVDGFQVTPYSNPQRNTLVPLGDNGKLPASIIPGGATIAAGTTGQVQFNTGGALDASANFIFTGTNLLTVTGNFKMVDGNQGSNKVMTSDSAGKATWQNIPTSVAGSDTQVQFNNSGAFGANADFAWDNTNNRLFLGKAVTATSRVLTICQVTGDQAISIAGSSGNTGPELGIIGHLGNGATAGFLIASGGAGHDIKIMANGGGTESITVRNDGIADGLVGINTVTPTYNLHVTGTLDVDTGPYYIDGSAGQSGTVTAGGHTLVFTKGILTSFT